MYYKINLVSFVDYDSNCIYSAWSLTDDIILSPNNVSILFFSLLVNVLLYHQLKIIYIP